MVRRVAWNGERLNCAIENSMPPEIDVRSANERGASTSWSPNRRAVSGPSITVQSITTFCAPTPDHSRKLSAILPCGPERMASSTCGFEIAAA